jgi:hypothetical protein
MQAWKLLTEGKEVSGAVFAVFKQTLYLQREGYARPALLCLGQRNIVEGPLNVCTSLSDLSCFEVEQPWRCYARKLTIADVCIDLSAAALWPTRGLSAQTGTGLCLPNADTVHALAQLVKDDHHLTGIEKAIHQRLDTESKQLRLWLRGEKNVNFPVGLLGCGPGLTPAGDDILVGALIALSTWHTPYFKRLSQQLRSLLNRPLAQQPAQEQTHLKKSRYATNDISTAHLLAACDGDAIAPLHALVGALTSATTTARTEQAAKALFNYGHSSGVYAMRGVLLAALCVAEVY